MRLILLDHPSRQGNPGCIVVRSSQGSHISTGDIFRSNIKEKTELGKLVSGILESGGLVPDDVTCEIVRTD